MIEDQFLLALQQAIKNRIEELARKEVDKFVESFKVQLQEVAMQAALRVYKQVSIDPFHDRIIIQIKDDTK